MAWSSSSFVRLVFLLLATVFIVEAATCSNNLTPSGPALLKKKGLQYRVVTNSLSKPRGIVFDSAGRLLVLDRGVGIKALTLKDDGGTCLSVTDTKMVVSDATLNHGIEFSNDGNTLYASTVSAVYSWNYDASNGSVGVVRQTLINGMFNTDHSTRTILASKKKPGTIVVNRGSQSNIDKQAANKASGHGQVKAFDVSTPRANPYDFTNDGDLLGWGIRNDVGVAEHPGDGGIWTVENSVDDISRGGVDFHDHNPGEKLNYMGTLVNNQSPNQGSNFGYPYCYAAWLPGQVPNAKGLKTGQQFTINRKKVSDKECRARTAPRLVFDAHMAPLDIKFAGGGNRAFVTMHGSHDRATPQGFKVSMIAYNNGQPVEPSTSRKSLIDLLEVKDKSSCPGNCMRPVGLALDGAGRLFMSSDNTGEIFVLQNFG